MRPYAGTGTLVRLALRRDRLMIPVWVVVFAVTLASTVRATAALYPDEASRERAAALVNSAPATVFLYGPVHDPHSLGALGTFKLTTMGAAGVGLLAMFLVRRHTRTDEESGRLELVGGGVVGGRAVLTAATLVSSYTVLLVCLVAALADVAVGLPLGGSLAFGSAWAGTGLCFVGFTALVAQLAQSARACAGIVATVLAAAYVLRGLGDATASAHWLAWLSPLGWTTLVLAYAGDRWWVLALPSATFAVLLAVAFALQDRRDLGAGLLPTRPGPARAPASLASVAALAWRLHRATLVGWAVAVALVGLLIGSLATSVAGMVTPQTRTFLEGIGGTGGLQEVFLSVEFAFLAIAISAYAIATMTRMAAEEGAGHAEAVLATSVRRSAWFASHTILALLGSAVLMLALGVTTALAYGAQTGDLPGSLRKVLPAALGQLPAVWVLAAVTAVLYAISRSWVLAGWGVLVACLLLGQLGDLLGLPSLVTAASPFSHSPKAPAEAVTAGPLLALVVVAAALLAAGCWRFRARDVG